MNATPDVSIVMPVYNGGAFVADAVRSALAQEGTLEIILHDDGSTDDTLAILRHLAAGDPRLSVSSGANAGPAAARNRCLGRVRGALVAFLDHDDIWPRGRLQRQAALLEADPSAGAVLGHTLTFETLDTNGSPMSGPRSRRVLCGLLQAGLFRREALDPLGGFDESLVAADDFDLLLRLLESSWKLKIDPEIAAHYRLHPGQWTADTRFSASQTVQALHRSLVRRRRDGVVSPLRQG